MRVLFVAHLLGPWESGRQRAAALRELGHDVHELALNSYYTTQGWLGQKARERLAGRSFPRRTMRAFGEELVRRVADVAPDLVWLEKPLVLLPHWLEEARRRAPGAAFVCFQDDDPFGMRLAERVSWRNFVDAIPLYDLHFVKRPQNVTEFRSRGARKVALFMHGVFSPMFHRHDDVPDTLRQDIVFVGTPLDHRVGFVGDLMGRYRLPLRIYGNSWNRTLPYWRHRDRFRPAVVADEYARVLSGSKICLGFVSSFNRDEYSLRTFEIPGCGSFFLGERTPVHQELFEEGEEAEFFASVEECADKCRYYLRNDSARDRVARRGFERCMRSEYTLTRRMRDALSEVEPR